MTGQWLAPWWGIDDESIRSELAKELEREVNRGHPLWGSSPRTVLAKRNDQDDILVSFDNGRIAEVHLTWTRKKELHGWPRTVIFNSLDDWRVQSMIPLHEEFLATGG
jgi:hypothetical protein